MKNNKHVAIAVIVGASVLAYWLATPSKDERQFVSQSLEAGQDDMVSGDSSASIIAAAGSEAVSSATPSAEPDPAEKKDSDPELEPVTRQLAQISAAYAAEIQYPPYSKPISASSKSYLEPNYFNVVEVPVLDGSHTASISLAKFRFFYPEPVVVSLNTKLAISNIRYEFYEPTTKQVLAVEQTERKTLEVMSSQDWPQEIRIKATIDFEQGSDILTTDFNFFVPSARLVSVDEPISDGADMLIPVKLDIKQAGIYRVRANLYGQQGGVIAALNGKSKLEEGEQEMVLKAHQSVLAGTDGLYQLKDWVIEKMSGFPGEKASFGISEQDTIPLAPFDLSALSQEPYTPSAEEQQRLEFLRQAANQ
ncbi:hypothetical protein BIT28_15730 [Photobacterium proteolyticum]|uniref:Uncharacterized protein n=1 Tax=Photobacterium proteolyticum TaxID=1903952 RepID=A0A1Q9GYZ6_9GAMM|nr:hypothetical protein [Photobacterium proteolyticum]OLQ80524.1 hypothetical protein BIT28_15730 [Photobacterium proteolyticum]